MRRIKSSAEAADKVSVRTLLISNNLHHAETFQTLKPIRKILYLESPSSVRTEMSRCIVPEPERRIVWPSLPQIWHKAAIDMSHAGCLA